MLRAEVARKLETDRTNFISRLESLGGVREGKTLALVAFPIKAVMKSNKACK